MTHFLEDPTGDIPWEEDEKAEDDVHLDSPQVSAVTFSNII